MNDAEMEWCQEQFNLLNGKKVFGVQDTIKVPMLIKENNNE